MTWRRILMVVGACELAFAVKFGSEFLAFTADPLPAIASAVTNLLPAFDLAQLLQ